MEITIKSLHIYPLKSAQGINLQEMKIVNSGPQWDREWMIIDKNNDFVTQRKRPEICHIKQTITNDFLILNAPQMEELKIPLQQGSQDLTKITLFRKETEACLIGNHFDQWISDFLGDKLRIVRSPEKPSRFTSGNHGPVKEILFADGYPLLLTTQSTLDELNNKLETAVPMNRFRPNIVVEGCPPNDEENWKNLEINGLHFESVKACTRCSVISIDQNTSQRNNEIVRTLSSYRKKDGQIIFGRNLSHSQTGFIKVGDTLTLT